MRGWEYIDSFGESLKIYGKGTARRLVDENGRIVMEYTMK